MAGVTGGRLRVAMYTDSAELGGAERCAALLVAWLPEEIDVTVVGVEPAVVAEVAGGRRHAHRVLVQRAGGKADLAGGARHVDVVRRLRPDVLHVHLRHPYACQWATVAGIAVPGVRVVATEHLVVRPSDRMQRRIKRLLCAGLAAHVAVGERSARELEESVGLAPGSVRTIPNGIPDRGALPARDEDAPFAIGFVGRLVPQKGVDVLLQALARTPSCELVVIGDGPERAALAALAVELGLADRVRFAGWQGEPRDLLASVDALVQPSRFEGMPLAIVEAMLAGLAVVASDVGSVVELIGGGAGVLVPPSDPAALARALADVRDPAYRRRLGAQARARALERYTVERMAGRYADLYAEMVG
jgi:glycosyltransferase involved in cell wall biosynthesis